MGGKRSLQTLVDPLLTDRGSNLLALAGALGFEEALSMLKSRRSKQYSHSMALPALIHSASGKAERVTITRLWYDGCEVVADGPIGSGECIDIEILGMGKIRGRVATASREPLLIRFIEECSV